MWSIDQKTPGQARTDPATTQRTRNAPNAFIDARDELVPLRDSVIDRNQHFKPTTVLLTVATWLGFGVKWGVNGSSNYVGVFARLSLLT